MALQTIVAFAPRRERRVLTPARLIVVASGLALAGCSMPISGFIDAAPTGSTKSATYPFAQEDWPKAEPALLSAIRADAADDPAQWSNAQSGRSGAVVAIGASYLKGEATCRAFVARIRDAAGGRAVQGDACEKSGHVTVSDARPFRGL